MPHRLGISATILSFVLWGLLPLYYQFMPAINMWELLSHRIVWSVLLLAPWVLLHLRQSEWSVLCQQPRQLALILLAGPVMSISWSMFTWCLTTGQVLATSLAFFMTPLFNIVFAVLFLHERPSLQKYLAIALAAAGLLYMLLSYGQLPWFSLIMGANFACYGLIKKHIKARTSTSLLLEALVQLPIALMVIGYFSWLGQGAFLTADWSYRWLIIGSAPVTLLPVALFCYGVSKTSMSTVGLLQYIEPSLAFLLAIFWFNEQPDPIKAVGFAFVWTGLLMSVLPFDKWWQQRRVSGLS